MAEEVEQSVEFHIRVFLGGAQVLFSLLSEEEDCLESVSTSARPNLLCLYQCHPAKSNDG